MQKQNFMDAQKSSHIKIIDYMDALKILDKEKEQSVDYDQVKLGDLKLQNFI